MTSAKVVIKEQDRSAIVPSFDGVYAGIVLVSDKGPVGVPTLITSINQLIEVFGKPNPKLGTSFYSARNYLSQGNKLWVVRAAHADSKYAASLVRTKIAPIPQGKTASLSTENLIVNPVATGLTEQELAAYQFHVYLTNKEYAELPNTLFESAQDTTKVRVSSLDGIAVGDNLSFSDETVVALNSDLTTLGEDTLTYKVLEANLENIEYDVLVLATPITVTKGMVISKMVLGAPVAYTGAPVVLRDATNATNIIVSNSDYIGHGDSISINAQITDVVEKNLLVEEAKFLVLDNKVTASATTDKILKVVQSEFEERDAFLVVAANQGAWGNRVSVEIKDSTNYDNAFFLNVFYDGVQVESWEVTRDNQLDGFQRQLQLEQKINGKSAYIKVVNNDANVTAEGIQEAPLVTDYSLWRRDPSDVFVDSTNTLTENLLKGHVEAKFSAVENIELGTRLKFVIDDNDTLSKEYKVQSFDAVEMTVILDRPIEEDQIDQTWIDNDGNPVVTKVFWFNPTLNDSGAGIIDGIQYYAIGTIAKPYYFNALNSRLVISGVEGSLVDAGANLAKGGTLGSATTVGDLVTAVKMLSNKEKTPVTLLMDGGFTYPAFAIAIEEVCAAQGLTHGYLSVEPSAEDSVNYLQAIVDYKNSTNLNTHRCSMFTGWVKVFDEYNQIDVWVSPEGFAAAAQSFTTRNYAMFYPAAGWTRGKLNGLDVKVKFSEGDRDYLVANRLNPIRYKEGSGLVIWANDTLLVKPSPMQLRSVSMLLIVIKTGLESMLEYKNFDLNDERTWGIVEGTINGFMRDEIQAKGGVYAYAVAVKDVITPSDLDSRRMPVFLGIQPTMDIVEIPVTLAIFNSGMDIEVAL